MSSSAAQSAPKSYVGGGYKIQDYPKSIGNFVSTLRGIDVSNSESNQISLNENASGKIRTISLKHAARLPNHGYHITSDLNWLRYLNQVEVLNKIIPPQSKVLDLGCGLGFTTALLASSCKDVSIVGVDKVEHSPWKELKKFGCDFCVCDATSLPFLTKSFEVIASFGVMEHIDSEMKFLREINRCLQNGGYNILFQLPNKYSFMEYMSKKMDIWHHERTYSGDDIKELIRVCGFVTICIAREHVIPAQVNRISRTFGNLFDKNHRELSRLDTILCKTPLCFFSQDYMLISKKL